jgi:hypothetical protein
MATNSDANKLLKLDNPKEIITRHKFIFRSFLTYGIYVYNDCTLYYAAIHGGPNDLAVNLTAQPGDNRRLWRHLSHDLPTRFWVFSVIIDFNIKILLLLLLLLWLYSPLLGLARFLSFLILYTVGRTPWTGNQPIARPLPTRRTAQTQNKRTQYRHPYLEWDSNPRSQCSSERRQFMP